MISSSLMDFEAHIQRDIEAVWALVRARKHEIAALIQLYLQEEKDLHDFASQYEFRFHATEAQRTSLKQQIEACEHKIVEVPVERDSLFEAWVSHPRDPAYHFHEQQPISDSDPADEEPVSLHTILEHDVDVQDSSPSQPNTASTTHVRKANLKKMVGDDLRWIYHRIPLADETSDIEALTALYHERDTLLGTLISHQDFDEVDILMRMPFEAQDEALWHDPLPRGVDTGERERCLHCGTLVKNRQGESDWDRLYRLRLWAYLLELGKARAEAVASSPLHKRYPQFQAWKQSGILLEAFFQQIAQELAQELHTLKERLHECENSK